jgi:hypothetical protein
MIPSGAEDVNTYVLTRKLPPGPEASARRVTIGRVGALHLRWHPSDSGFEDDLRDMRMKRPRIWSLLAAGALPLLLATCGKDSPSGPDGEDTTPAELAIITQPAVSVVSGAPISVSVEVRNSQGAKVNTNTTVTVSLVSDGSGAVLNGVTSVAAIEGVAEFTNLTIAKAGVAYRLNATASNISGGRNTNTFSVTAGAPAKLTIQGPPSVQSLVSSPSIQVTVLDAASNHVTTATTAVTLTLTSGTGTVGATIGGTLTKDAVGGIANFTDIIIDKAGTGYTITPIATGLTSIASGPFAVTPGATSKLVFIAQPTSVVAGVTINDPGFQVGLQDAAGNNVNDNRSITVAIAPGSGAAGATLGGSKTGGGAGGVTFNGLTIDKAATNYALVASSASLTSATSAPFSVTPGLVSKLAFLVQPSSATSGAAISPALQVAVTDSYGNIVTTTTHHISLSITSGTGTAGATLSGTTGQGVVNGIATFSDVSIAKAGVGYTLRAETSNSNITTSSSFSITAGAASQLGLATSAAGAPSGGAFTTQPGVAIRDAAGNTVTTDNSTVVTMTVSAGASVVGTATATASAGLATFANVGISGVAGTSYTLTFSSGALTEATQSITPSAGAASQLVLTTNAAGAPSGAAFTTKPVVAVRDAAGSTVTSDFSTAITMTVSSGATVVGTATVGASAGLATFNTAGISGVAGTVYTLTFSSGGLTPATQPITPTAGAATQLVLLTSAAGAVNGVAFSMQPAVSIRDAAGNILTSDNSSVVAMTVSAGATVVGVSSATASAGVATFGNAGLTGPAGAYTLTFAKGGVTSATQPIDLANGAADFAGVWSGDVTTNSSEVPVLAMVLDLAAGGGAVTGTSSLGGVAITNVAVTNGVLTFSFPNFQQGDPDCNAWDLNGSGTLNAARNVMTLAISGAICGPTLTTIAGSGPLNKIGPATQLAITTQAAGAVSGAAFSTQPVVEIRDAAGRRVPTDNGSVVTMTVNSNGSTVGTATATATAGVATFTTVGIAGTAGASYTLTFSRSGLTSATQGITLIAGPPSQLQFTIQPSAQTVGSTISTVQVSVRDATGNTINSANNTITLALLNNAAGAVLGGTTTVSATNGLASFGNLTLDKPGQGFTLQATATGLSSVTSNAFIAIGPLHHLVITAQPSNVVRNALIAPSIVVAARDAAGNHVNSGQQIAVAIGTNPGGAVLGGTLTRTMSSGLATFNDITVSAAGVGYTLVASAPSVTGATSSTFDVAAFGPATKVGFIAQPTNATIGSAISPDVQLAIQDAVGNTVTSSSSSITVAFGANPGGATLGGTLTTAAVAGVANFADLSVSGAGNNYTLTGSSGSLTSATSAAFNIVDPAAAIKLGFIQQPTSTTAGSTLVPAVTVAIQNSSGATVTSDNSTVVSITLASGPPGGTVRGTLSATASNGIATFSTLNDTVAGDYTLRAVASGLTSGTSASYTISAGVAVQLIFLQPPTNTIAGELFAPTVRVAVADVYGNTVPSATNSVTVDAFTSFSCCGDASAHQRFASGKPALAGSKTEAAVDGVAVFTDLRPRWAIEFRHQYLGTNQSGFGGSFTAQAAGLTQAYLFNAFTVTPSTPAKIGVGLPPSYCCQPPSDQTANVGFGVTAVVLDSLDNQVNAGSDLISLAIGNNPSAGALTTANNVAATNGKADFNLSIDKGGNGYTLVASAAGLTSLPSLTFNVLPFGAASRVGFKTQPSNTSVDVAIAPAPQVCVQDGAGNTVTNATNSITIAIGTNPGATTLGGTVTANAVSGCATFADLTLGAAASGYRLTATASGLLSANSTQFNVAAQGTVQGALTYTGAGTPSASGLLYVAIYPFSNTNMQGAPNGSTIQAATSSSSPLNFSFNLPPGDYHLIAMFDANADGSVNSGNTDPYLIYTPGDALGTGTFGLLAAKITVAAGQTVAANVSLLDTHKK